MRLSEDLKPIGELELVLVERIIDLFWRLRRSRKLEAGILAWYQADLMMKRGEEKMYRAQRAPLEDAEVGPGLKALLDNARSMRDYLQRAKETDLATSGEVYVDDARKTNALTKISRYETSMERSLFKTLHELERRQALRQGKEVPVPLAVDIDVTGAEPEALRITPAREKLQAVEEPLERPSNNAAD